MQEHACGENQASPTHLAFNHFPAYARLGSMQHGNAYVRPEGEEQDGDGTSDGTVGGTSGGVGKSGGGSGGKGGDGAVSQCEP